MLFVGWDWASETHDVTVIDDTGEIVDRWALRHDATDLAAALTRLAGHGDPEDLPVAIETTSGLVVDRLLAAGHPVVPIHPNAFNAARPRWSASRATSDTGDSFKLADYLRTDGHRLRRLEPLDDATAEVQALSRMRDDHVEAKVAATNQLRALLERHWPGATTIFARLDSDIALAFLDDYPTPVSAARLGEARMKMFCRRHSYCGRRDPAVLIERLRSAPEPTEPFSPEILAELVRTQVRLLRTLLATIADLDRAMSAALLEHSKAPLLAPLPRIGEINLAQVIGEVGPILTRALDVDHACAEVGATPVTKESGKGRAVNFRWAVNTRARKALFTFADNSRHASPWAAKLYNDARARGKRHPHAIRILMRAWMRVIWSCWHTNTAYDPTLHGAQRRLVTTTDEEIAA
ncbi:IS110 family transposase [Rhabdothermincola sp.]|uniref:IS110 family transposase n=1 Tax=Rhabdothermincola sp. TaxID=2820405 RepID=UPI002FDFBA11